MDFKLVSSYSPTGDQPEAIEGLVNGINEGLPAQTLLGVTGSGKTFTMANVIARVNKPTLILSHNKTLAAQLYTEFKGFFPDNAVEYFVSYYDYYQPEAYIPTTDTYIEKDLAINEEIDRLRLAATSALLSGRKDVVVVSSVSCLYGIGNPQDFNTNLISIHCGDTIGRNTLLRMLVDALYSRNETEPARGTFRVKGDCVEIYLAYDNMILRVSFWGEEIESIECADIETGRTTGSFDSFNIYPANLFVTSKERIDKALEEIACDLDKQVLFFNGIGKELEAKRLYERVSYDMEMIKEIGHCSGIENYSRYFDGREPGSRPFCLLDYFPKDFLVIIDESHVTVPQIRAMYGGDHSRKLNLVEYGFRLPAAIDNRPLKFAEFEALTPQVIYVSATPADYELEKSEGVIVEQVVRPTGLLDPVIEVRPSLNQIDDLLEEIQRRIEKNERVLVTTLGVYDVLIGVNLLREGLDLPEVSLVAILDADKEGFLRSHRSLTQTAGRAARNLNGTVIMYADKITESMQQTIDETNRRREKQIKYNKEHNITPKAIKKAQESVLAGTSAKASKGKGKTPTYNEEYSTNVNLAADPVVRYMDKESLKAAIEKCRSAMGDAAKRLEFIEAARLRDELLKLQEMLDGVE